MNTLYVTDFHVALWIAATLGAVLLFRRYCGAPTLLLVIGAAGYAGWQVMDSLIIHQVISPDLLGRHSTTLNALDYFFRYASVCFCIGFLWFALRVRRT